MTGYVIKKAIDLVFARLTESLRKAGARTSTSEIDIEEAVAHHLREVKNWSSEVSFADLKGPKATYQVFIPLDLMLAPRKHRMHLDEPSDLTPLEELVGDPTIGHVIILGQPGAGKTTSMKHICQRLLEDPTFNDAIDFPILVRLRDFNSQRVSQNALVDKIQELLGIKIEYATNLSGKEHAADRRTVRTRTVIECADAAKILLVLDGFDEIASLTQRERLIEEARKLAQQLERSRIILTSRTGEFNYHIENMRQFEISPLSDAQILSFASRWLGSEDGKLLVSQISRSPFADTAIRPLTIAHLCALYERSRKIPEKPKTMYRKIVRLLIEEWDEQRSIKRSSAYASFDVDRKFEFLSQLAYVLTTSASGPNFSKRDLIAAYGSIHGNFGLPGSDATKVASELETHTGLLLQAGYEQFEFSHKSLQEYLAAEFIVRLPNIPSDSESLLLLPNELAIATAISSTPSDYFAELVLHRFDTLKTSFQYTSAFVSRLLLERPDFEETPRVGAALLALYSQYLHSMLQSSDQMHLFVIDRLGEVFEELGKLIKQRISEEDLMALFEIIEDPPSIEGGRILRLSRRKKPSPQPTGKAEDASASITAQRILAQSLPTDIWARPALLASLRRSRTMPSTTPS